MQASLPALKALPSPDSRESPGWLHHKYDALGDAVRAGSDAPVALEHTPRRLGRAPLAALAAIFCPNESSFGETTSTDQGPRKPS